MLKWVKASSGDKLVIELTEDVYALSGRGSCIFAEDPDSFYKFGYFDVSPDSVKIGTVKKAVKDLKEAADALSDENSYRVLIPPLSVEAVKSATSEFLKRIEKR